MPHAAQLREDFSAWVTQQLALDPEKSADVVLAVNEALANAAEHAYQHCAQPGPMHIRAEHDPELGTLTVWIADEGRWHLKDPAMAPNPGRGRGTMLIRALADRCVVDSTPTGTEVRVQWDHVGARRPATARQSQDDDLQPA